MPISVNDSATWRTLNIVSVYDAGTWRNAKAIYIYEAGAWRTVYGDNSGTLNYTTPTTFDWTVPEGVFSITVNACGGAGGGGGGDAGANYNGDGASGGGANLITATFAVTPLQVLNVIVGGGGFAGPIGGDGGDGTPTTITGTDVLFATGAGTHGGGWYTGREIGIGANGANNGTNNTFTNAGGTSTNGGANGGAGGRYKAVGVAGGNGKLTITY